MARKQSVTGAPNAATAMVPVRTTSARRAANPQRPLARAIFMIVAGLVATTAAAHAGDLTSDPVAAAAAGGTASPAADSAPQPAAAGSVTPPVKPLQVKRLEGVVVTGSLIQVRSRSEVSSSPLATIGIDQIAAAVRSGCCSVDQIGTALKAGTNCGSCRSEIKRILDATASALEHSRVM